jgi:hypothetical protein
MPVTANIDSTARFAVVSITDPYTIEEWRAAMLVVWESPVFGSRRALLIDRRRSEPPSTAFVEAMATFFSRHQAKIAGTRAAIVVRDDSGFGMGRMTELKASLENPDAMIRPFRDYDEAVRWLTDPAFAAGTAGRRAPPS